MSFNRDESRSLSKVAVNDEEKKTTQGQDPQHPVDRANPLSFSTFTWMNPIISSILKVQKKRRHGFEDPDISPSIPPLSSRESVRTNLALAQKIIEARRNKRIGLGGLLWTLGKKRILLGTTMYMFSLLLGFISASILMKKVLTFASSSGGEMTKSEGVVWISLLILFELARVLFFTLTWAVCTRTAFRLKAATMGLIYRKILTFDSVPLVSDPKRASKIINLITGDCARIHEAVTLGQISLGGPVILILSLIYIYWELGWLSLVGMSVFPAMYPVQYLLARWSGALRKKAVEVRDVRISLLSEALQNYKFIKMSGWEGHLNRLLSESRTKEERYLRGSGLLSSLGMVLAPTLPHIGAIVTFSLYLSSPQHSLTAPQAFTLLALLVGRVRPTIMRARTGFNAYFSAIIAIQRIQCFTIMFVFSLVGFSVRTLNMISDIWFSSRIAIGRIQKILDLPDKAEVDVDFDVDPSILVTFENVWIRKGGGVKDEGPCKVSLLGESSGSDDTSTTFLLKDISLTIPKGRLIGVCGPVGGGKSIFLEAVSLLLSPSSGRILPSLRRGRVAYVPQSPWMFKDTVRGNITFGEPFDSLRYYNTIDLCALVQDFGALPQGDLTPTDEKGSNLSGGQKARIALARAVYSFDKELYVLDSPLSSLDSVVGASVFERVVQNHLVQERGATVLLACNQPQYLMQCHEILVFANGGVVARGSHGRLLRTSTQYNSIVMDQVDQSVDNNNDDASYHPPSEDQPKTSSSKEPSKPALLKGQSSSSSISRKVYLFYIACAGGFLTVALVLGSFALSIGSTAFSSWWLKRWFNHPHHNSNSSSFNETSSIPHPEVITMDSEEDLFYRNIYILMISVIFVTGIGRAVLFALTCIKATRAMHQRLTSHFLEGRLKTISQLGTGHILNLFSRDVGEIDSGLPPTLEQFLQNLFIILSIMFLICLVFPIFIIPLILLFLLFLWIRNTYISVVRNLKRLESEVRTPIITKLTETMEGLPSIRAFGKETLFTRDFEDCVNAHHSILFILSGATRWLSLRLDTLAVGVTGVVATLILVFHGAVTGAGAGLALAYAAQLSGIFQFTVRLATETEAKFVSVERIYNFVTRTPKEEETPTPRSSLSSDEAMLPTWPYAGNLKFDSVTLSYSGGGSSALRNVSFEIVGGQKIGIIGRTGCGKSSLSTALFRLTEITSGQITLDGVDISSLGLSVLRDALAIIPQDPSVFQHSLRFNLDPGSVLSDPHLWGILKKVGLASRVESLEEEVSSFSNGEKQLLSVARALLRKPKVLFVDEATAGIDPETSFAVNSLLASSFQDTTLLIVSHQVTQLSFCDKILVLENGTVRDFCDAAMITRNPASLRFLLQRMESIPI